jgi:hypothetical protein
VGIDLLATAYTSTSRPPPLLHHHVRSYLERVAQGGDPIPGSLQAGGGDSLHSTGDSTEQHMQEVTGGRGDSGGSPEPGSGSEESWVGPDSWQLLFHSQDPAGVLQVSSSEVDFGACSCRAAAGQQSFVVTNNSSAKLVAFVVVPGAGAPGKAAAPAGTTSTFQVCGSALQPCLQAWQDGPFVCRTACTCPTHHVFVTYSCMRVAGRAVPLDSLALTAAQLTAAQMQRDQAHLLASSTLYQRGLVSMCACAERPACCDTAAAGVP